MPHEKSACPIYHENAAGKKLCGMCEDKAAEKGVWRCKRLIRQPAYEQYDGMDFYPCPAPDGDCPGFQKKPSSPRPPQAKTKGLVPQGIKFLYVGRPPGGVVTVAYDIAERVPLVEIAFSFCSPKDRWCKATGRDLAVARLQRFYLTVPYLYSPKRTVHEVVRAVVAHDWRTLFYVANFVHSDLRPFQNSVPDWTRRLAGRLMRHHPPFSIAHLDKIFGPPLEVEIPLRILAHMLADIAKLGK